MSLNQRSVVIARQNYPNLDEESVTETRLRNLTNNSKNGSFLNTSLKNEPRNMADSSMALDQTREHHLNLSQNQSFQIPRKQNEGIIVNGYGVSDEPSFLGLKGSNPNELSISSAVKSVGNITTTKANQELEEIRETQSMTSQQAVPTEIENSDTVDTLLQDILKSLDDLKQKEEARKQMITNKIDVLEKKLTKVFDDIENLQKDTLQLQQEKLDTKKIE